MAETLRHQTPTTTPPEEIVSGRVIGVREFFGGVWERVDCGQQNPAGCIYRGAGVHICNLEVGFENATRPSSTFPGAEESTVKPDGDWVYCGMKTVRQTPNLVVKIRERFGG